MAIDSAWIFRICLVMAVTLILFADFLGYGGANARKNDKSEDYEDYTAEDHETKFGNNKDKINGKHVTTNYKKAHHSKAHKEDHSTSDDERIDVQFYKKVFSEKERLEQKRNMDALNQKIGESLRELCLPKLFCEIAAKPTYLLTEKEKHLLSLLRSAPLSIVAQSPSVYQFSSHMGQLMRHSADSMGGPIQGCAMLWPHCPYSSEKLMRISTKARLR